MEIKDPRRVYVALIDLFIRVRILKFSTIIRSR